MEVKKQPVRIEKTARGWLVNNSSLDIVQTCLRKADYVFNRPESDRKTAPLLFGSAIHSGLGVFYQTHDRGPDVLSGMIEAFKKEADQIIKDIPAGDKRSIECGEKILTQFFNSYKDGLWDVLMDDKGPFMEREFEVDTGLEVDGLPVIFRGTMDTMLKHRETGELVVCDHKTATSLGQQFAQKADMNHQLTGYVFAAQKMGYNVKQVMFQGLQVAKTKQEVMRIFAERTEEQIIEWKTWLLETTGRWADAQRVKVYPHNGSLACTVYGGCQYLNVCAAPLSHRDALLKQANNVQAEEE